MLDTDTKRRIDTARDILVGKVPDPKSQVEQITIALIYKFMDDMDAESEELGGERKFFAGEFAKYGWAKLMRSGLGGHEMLGLYGEAITRMPENPGIPPLFRDIFKNAYLPYRDPETLRAFLKIIDEFAYDHSERLGDAFEYLLSVLGSQGDAGQFRTPRHIIDFIVSIVDPKKDETVLDPACGTAGFLISSYKHILSASTDADGNSTLTPDERGRLAANFKGYDISPDMVRLSLVNMYLHGFTDPHIHEYDTLTSQDRWNEYADVILANPPFMTPTGGIKPHTRFSVQSKRSEVLFVDYIAEHLRPGGRAGVIVPEGIVFQSQNAYQKLRKMLVEDSLVAVVSLPAGVFNPYSGVKTCILILDKALSRKTQNVLFLKVENDGTDLGARRRVVADSDLPHALSAYQQWAGSVAGGVQSELWVNRESCAPLVVPKATVAADGSYNLTAERHRLVSPSASSRFPMRRIGDFVSESTSRAKDEQHPVWSVSKELGFVESEQFFDKQVASADIRNYKVVVPRSFAYNPSRINVGSIALNRDDTTGVVSPMYVVFAVSGDTLSEAYLFALLKSEQLNREINRVAHGAVRVQLRFKELSALSIPVPPREVQEEIVAQLDRFDRIIRGARMVVEGYRPSIPEHADWPLVRLSDLCVIKSGGTPSRSTHSYWGGDIPWVTTTLINNGVVSHANEFITAEGLSNSSAWVVPRGTVLMAMYGQGATRGRVAVLGIDAALNQACAAFVIKDESINPDYLYRVLQSRYHDFRRISEARGGNQSNLSARLLKEYTIPCPPKAVQRAIVADLDDELALVNANRDLIVRFENKTRALLVRVWEEARPASQEA